jgi:hypothetical protein
MSEAEAVASLPSPLAPDPVQALRKAALGLEGLGLGFQLAFEEVAAEVQKGEGRPCSVRVRPRSSSTQKRALTL